jgi:hypothetical protein
MFDHLDRVHAFAEQLFERGAHVPGYLHFADHGAIMAARRIA